MSSHLLLHVMGKCMGKLPLVILLTILPFNHCMNWSIFLHVTWENAFASSSWINAWEYPIDHPICPFIVNIFVCILTSQFLTLSQWHLSSHLNKHFYFIIEFFTKLCFWNPWSGFFHYWVFWKVAYFKDLKMIPHLGQWHKGPLLFVFSK